MQPESDLSTYIEGLDPVVRAQVADQLGDPSFRRRMARVDLAFFDYYYCNMTPAPFRTRWLNLFKERWESAQTTQQKLGLLVLGPRGHGKTEAIITFITWLICTNRDTRILLVAMTEGVATDRLKKIVDLLRSEKIVADWTGDPADGAPAFEYDADGKRLEWNKTSITVHRKALHVDPTVAAVGVGGSITGKHPDVVLFDDIEDDKSVVNAALRRQRRAWFTTTVWPTLNPGGVLVNIGTRKHEDDFHGHLFKHPAFRAIVDPAIFYYDESGARVPYTEAPEHTSEFEVDEHGQQRLTDITILDTKAQVLWPKGRPLEYILRERHTMIQSADATPGAFEREYQHIVSSDVTALIKTSWLQAARDKGTNLSMYKAPFAVDERGVATGMPLDLRIIMAWDLSLNIDAKHAELTDSDYTVGVTIGYDANTKRRYLLGLCRFRGGTPGEKKANVLAEYQRVCAAGLAPSVVLVERNSFGNLLLHEFVDNDLNVPFVGFDTTKEKKHDAAKGVSRLRTHFEYGRYVFPFADAISRELVGHLTGELFSWPRGKHDDCVMALWAAEYVLSQYSGVVAGGGRLLADSSADPMVDGVQDVEAEDAPPTTTPESRREAAWQEFANAVWDDRG